MSSYLRPLAASTGHAYAREPARTEGDEDAPARHEWAVVGGCSGLYLVPAGQVDDYFLAFGCYAVVGVLSLLALGLVLAWG